MIQIENISWYGFAEAIRGMRNPMNSWDKSDTMVIDTGDEGGGHVGWSIGSNDISLMKRLNGAGTEQSKYRRMIVVYMDITAPLYWWKEFDTYKVGTVANSCSTMHKIGSRELSDGDFSTERLSGSAATMMHSYISELNRWIRAYQIAPDSVSKRYYWDNIIQMLPTAYNQRRTVMLNYEVLAAMYRERKNHKQPEWRKFCETIRKELPYPELFTNDISEDRAE